MLHDEVRLLISSNYILIFKLDDMDAAFREVVSLDFHRILSRLRCRHAKCTRKTAKKQPLIKQLYDTVYTRSIKATVLIKEGRSKVRKLQSLLTRLESISDLNAGVIEAKEVVGTIIRQLYAFFLSINLGRALQTSMLEPSLKAHLPEAISKVGRYYFTLLLSSSCVLQGTEIVGYLRVLM
jgi:hypothetical protein